MAESNSSTPQNSENSKPKAKYYRYPLRQIRSNTDYFEISIVEYKPPGLSVKEGTLAGTIQGSTKILDEFNADPKTKTLASICLPIPQNISDNNSVTWGEDTLNPLQAFGLGLGKSAIDAFKDNGSGVQMLENIYKTGGAAFEQVAKDKTIQNIILTSIGGRIANTLGGNVSYNSIISRATGQVFNSNLELLFSGPNMRTFPFIFEFVPRDRAEASEVKNIIKTFKSHMSAKDGKPDGAAKGIFLGTPDVFILKYKTGNKNHPFLNKFKPCALVDMNVVYTGSGTYATYQDSSPVHLQMTLTFKELNPIYSSDYSEEVGGVGY